MEYDLTDDAKIVSVPEGFALSVGDTVKRKRFDGSIDTFIVVPSGGSCTLCDFSYKYKNQYSWDICLPNPGPGEKMCDKCARGVTGIMFKSIDKLLEDL